MKKYWKLLSVVALASVVMLGSCKKEENNTNAKGCTILAGIEQPTDGAKTSLDPSNGAIYWTAGDKINVTGEHASAIFTLRNGGGSANGVFHLEDSFEETGACVAAYPADAEISGTNVTFDLPSTQTAAVGSFGNGANPMVAYTSNIENGLTFQSVCGAMRVRLTGEGVVTKLVLTSKNTSDKLWGTLTVDASAVTPTSCTGGSNVLTVNIPGGVTASGAYGEGATSPEVFITLPAGVLASGFKLEAYNGNNKLNEKETTSAWATIEMNTVSSPVAYFVELPHGTVASQTALTTLLAEVSAGTYTGPITIAAGNGEVLDFGGATIPNNKQVVIAEGVDATIKNFSATTSTANPAMVIESGATVELSNVSLTSTSTASNSRAINVAGAVSGEGISVTLNDCNLEGGTAGYSRGLNVWSDGEPVEVNVVGGEIHAGHYAVNIPTSENVTINLSNASIASGWAAINVWGENNTVNATNCILRGTNDKTYNADGWNDFATIAFNNDNVNNTVNLAGCEIIAEATTGNKQYIIRMYTGGNTISVDNACTISKGVGNPNTPNWYAYYAGSNTTGSNWEIDDATFEAFNAAWGAKGLFNGKATAAQVLNNDSSMEK